ncbi:MAG: ABC transporter permease subunit, partial [Anaerolineae bacterium]|nr:ABC transporter permease subunit [Anaerolineae bacterium]
LLQYLEIAFYRNTGIRLLPVGGFGWDRHLVLPVLVLAARPVAQVARLTYAQVSEVLGEDYMRTAHAKGLGRWRIWFGHVFPNAAGVTLTAMGTSLRFSLSSLPVVEVLFGWPGAGRAMLDMLRTSQRDVATVLVLMMGGLFVGVDVLLDILYRVLDPRLREAEVRIHIGGGGDWLRSFAEWIWGAITLRRWRERRQSRRETLPSLVEGGSGEKKWPGRRGGFFAHALGQTIREDPSLAIGLLVMAMLLALVFFGPAVAPHDPYHSQLFVMVNGQMVMPPLAPSSTYPLGTDAQGRDILSLLLVGARRTLSIALLAVLARLLIGGVLGFLAGWFEGSTLDRAIVGLAEALAAFPALLLAMLVVYAVGIRQGLKAFVIGLSFIGWGEVMQTVRSQVMRIKPMAYVESAVATGLSQGQILTAHVLPSVWPTMVSLAFLEMGGVLMLLGELGFLGVFIGGGLGAEGDGAPVKIYYDVPEWSVMLANSWRSFRSYPWAILYPGLAFFVAILGFTFLGEGLRRFFERWTVGMRRLFNRYTLAVAFVAVLGVRWILQSNSLYAAYAPQAMAFDARQAQETIQQLAGPEFNGRLSGTGDAERAADWIAQRFAELGLQPGGEEDTYFQTFSERYWDLIGIPSLLLVGPHGQRIQAQYGRDFVWQAGPHDVGGWGKGEVVLVSASKEAWSSGQLAGEWGIPLAEVKQRERILLRLSPESLWQTWLVGHQGILTLGERPLSDYRYELLAQAERQSGQAAPSVWVSRDLVERLLEASGRPLDAWLAEARRGKAFYLPTGWYAELAVPSKQRVGVPVRNVIGYWPGVELTANSQVVMVTAYYDGLGRFPDGTLYPGANDNASGVATMLEMIR